MGQRSSRCKEAENDFGRVYICHHGTPPQSSTLVDVQPHPDGVGEEDVSWKKKKGRKEDTSKKKKRFRFWRWACFRKAGQKSIKKTSSAQDEETPGRIPDGVDSLQQVICNVEIHHHQEPSASDPDVPPSSEEHLAVHPDADVLQSPLWSGDVPQTPLDTASNWSADITQTTVCSESEWGTDVTQAPVRTPSDWSIDVAHAPAHTVSDWSIDVAQTPVHRTSSDWSSDIIETSVCTASDWSANVTQTPARIASDWSVDVGQTMVRTVSDWSTDVIQHPVCPTEFSVSRQLENNRNMKTEVINSCHYVIGDLLGEGNFGAVYEGSRQMDGLKVAVKYVTKTIDVEYISIPGNSKSLPLEVALLTLVNKGPRVPEIIQLLDWQDQHDHYIMVLERPSPCEDLFGFAESHGGSIDESLARVIMWQVTQAACICCHRGVLHRDIKLENLLINKETLEVKLIDFGCGDLLTKAPYKIFTGTDQYCPPEYAEKGMYNGKPLTVWSLGVLLFALVCGDYPSTDDLDKINANNYSKDGLSKECCQLISSCLQRNPKQRLRLSQILLHDWFKHTDLENFKSV